MSVTETDKLQDTRRERLSGWIREHGGAAAVARDRHLKGSAPSYLSQLMGGYSFGEKAARSWEKKLGMPTLYLDGGTAENHQFPEPQAGQMSLAHDMSLSAFTLPPQLTWEQFVQAKVIPETFTLQVPDGALAPKLQKGETLIFRRADRANPRECILVETSSGKRYMRRYAEGTGSSWQAQALDDAFISLDSERDGLRILAVMEYKKGSEI